MNREVISEGVLANNTRGDGIVRGYQGMSIAYDAAGDRLSVSTTSLQTTSSATGSGGYTYNSDDDVHTEYYTYSQDGYLATVSTADQIEDAGEGAGTATTSQTKIAQYTTDAMGRVTTDYNYTPANPTNGEAESSTTVSTYDADGDLLTTTDTEARTGYTQVNTAQYYYNALSGSTYTGAYQGGVVVAETTTQTNNGASQPNTSTVNSYIWWTQAEESLITYNPNTAKTGTYATTLTYDPNGHLISAYIGDGQPHEVTYVNNVAGEVLDRTDSAGPEQEYYYLGAQTIGDIGNAGPSQTDYASAINQQYQGATASAAANFDQNYTAISPTNPGDSAATYTVQAGDTLQSIAQTLWGDSNLWYLIADANGLSSSQTLAAGSSLIIPNDVINIGHTSSTGTPYNSTQATGYIQPTAAPPPHKSASLCATIGNIIIEIIGAVVSTIVGPVAGDLVTQGLKLATGLQSKFSWNELGESFVQGLVDVAVPQVPIVGPAIDDALAQGIDVATGLQKQFNWSEVATQETTYIAGPFAAAAVNSAMTGTSYGQSLEEILPNFVGQTVGNLIAGNIESQPQGQSSGNGSSNPLQALWNGIENVGGAIVGGVEAVGGAIVNGVETVGGDIAGAIGSVFNPSDAAATDGAQGASAQTGTPAVGQHFVGVNANGDNVYAYNDTTTPNGANGGTDVGEVVVTASRTNNNLASTDGIDSGFMLASFSNPIHLTKGQYVNSFYGQSAVLAAKLGHGATAAEILAMSANESTWGGNFKASDYGNYFGLHNIGSGPFTGQTGSYLSSGQVGVFGTVQNGWVAPTAPGNPQQETPIFASNGFYNSGMVLVNSLASTASGDFLADPASFFASAWNYGWGRGSTQAGYVSHMLNIYNHSIVPNLPHAN